jgi:hypothetical protein
MSDFKISYIYEAVDKFSPVINDVVKKMENVNKQIDIQNSKINVMKNNLGSLSSALSSAGTALTVKLTAPLVAASTALVAAAADVEKITVSFYSMLHSVEKSQQLSKQLQAFSAENAFNFNEIQLATKNLINAGVPFDQLIEKLAMLGDISKGSLYSIESLGQIVQRTASKGVLGLEELNRLEDASIPITKELAKLYNMSEKDIRKAIGKNQISSAGFQEGLRRLTTESGPYFNKLKLQADTVSGAFGQLKGQIYLSSAAIGEQIMEVSELKQTLVALRVKLKDITVAMVEWMEQNPELTKLIIKIGLVVAALGPVLIGLSLVVKTVRMATVAVIALGVAFKALLRNPIVLILTLIGALLIYLYQNSEDFRNSANALFKVLYIGFKSVFDFVTKYQKEIMAFFDAVWTVVMAPLEAALFVIRTLANALRGVFGLLTGANKDSEQIVNKAKKISAQNPVFVNEVNAMMAQGRGFSVSEQIKSNATNSSINKPVEVNSGASIDINIKDPAKLVESTKTTNKNADRLKINTGSNMQMQGAY